MRCDNCGEEIGLHIDRDSVADAEFIIEELREMRLVLESMVCKEED